MRTDLVSMPEPSPYISTNLSRAGLWSRLFSFPAMLVVGIFCAPFFAGVDVWHATMLRDPDVWWHMRNAQVLLATHHFIQKDLYSFTTLGQAWIDPEWLAEIPYYLGWRILGERGIFLVALAAMELVVGGLFLLCYRRCGDIKSAFLATWVGILFATVNLGPRTILFGWSCFLGMLFILEAFRKGRDFTWLLVPMFALWINLHGSWLIGLVFFFLFVASGLMQGSWGCIDAVRWTPQQLRKLGLVAAASVAALFANPYGWRLVMYPFDMIFHQKLNIAVVQEWQSVNFQAFHGVLFFLTVSCMLLFTLAKRRPWPLHELLFLLLASYSALTHERFMFLAGIVLAPMISVELQGLVFDAYDPENDKPLLNALIMAAALVVVILHIPTSAKMRAGAAQWMPRGAVAEMQRCCAGRRVFNDYAWGGYLIWNARNTPVFLDSRTDVFEYHGVLLDDIKAITMHDSLAILDRYRIDTVLQQPDSGLVYLLKHTPGWHVQYEDATAALLVRDPR